MKKLTTLLVSLIFTVMLCLPAFGANVTVKGKKCITITGLDADWYATTEGYPSDLDIWCVVFYPSATGDIMVIHDDGLDTWVPFESGESADKYDKTILYLPPGMKIKPVIDISDCTLGTAANAKVKIYFR